MLRLLKRVMLGTLLITCLSSCLNYPKIQDQEQLSLFLAEPVEINGSLYIPVDGSGCFSRVYRITSGYIGPISSNQEYGVYECHKMVGRAPREYGVFATWMENFRVWLNRRKRR